MSLSRLCSSVGLLAAVLYARSSKPKRDACAVVIDTPHLNDTAELARVVSLYEAGKYGECADSLHLLLSADSRGRFAIRTWSRARASTRACLIGSGQNQAATSHYAQRSVRTRR